LPYVRFLNLADTAISDSAVRHLTGLPLQKLYLGGTKLTDKGALQLQELRELQLLELFLTQVTEAGVAELRRALPGCEIGFWKSGG